MILTPPVPRPEHVRRAASLPPSTPTGIGISSAPEAEVYLAIKKAGMVRTEAEIARATDMNEASVSKCIRSLQEKNIVRRNTSGLGGGYFYIAK